MVKSNGDLRLDRQIALIVGAITVGLLARDVVPDLLPGDAGEFHFAAWQWGLAHPTGYPVYLLAGGAWQRVLAMFGISPAFALNLLSALFLGIAAALFYWLLIGWLPGSTVVRRVAALLAVAFFVVNPTVRSQGLLAEVYTLHALFIVAILLAAQRVAMPAADLSQARAGGWLTVMTLLLGLSLAHHATTLLLVPPLVVYLFLANRTWWRSMRAWLWAVPAFLLPLLFYLYVPLRSGAEASPWYHQRLGNGVLTLYDGTWNAFANFVTGRSISVGFYRPGEAMAALPAVFTLWLRHFEWPGFLLIVVGLFVLVRVRNWPVLTLTVGYLVIQQTFNLFYAIDDIFVYYVPLYLLACIWVGYAAAGIGMGFRLRPETAPPLHQKTTCAGRWLLL